MSDEPTIPLPQPPDDLRGLDAGELFARGLQTAPPSAGAAPWEPPTPEELAKLLPQYRIESLLGRGGMGAVYKGVQAALDRPVAIKLLPAELAGNGDFLARFQREARTLAKLQHPGIVTVYDFGQTSAGHLYFVMEYVDGTDLQHILKGPGLRPEQAFVLIGQICEALHYAHQQGVIHRDIKPANILVTKDGRAKVADFGLARPLTEESGGLTQTNMVMGTPDYMAPEQRTGVGHPDHRADIFALGVMLYEMLTGQRPHGAFQPPSQRVQVDVRIDEVVLKALQQEPDRRYQQASEMKTDVDRIRTTPMQSAPKAVGKTKPVRRSPLTLSAAILLPLLAIIAALFHFAPWKKGDAGRGSGELRKATKDAPFVNSLGMKFVPVPGTDILMCIHETRRTDYGAYAAAVPGVDRTWKNPMVSGNRLKQQDDHPVVMVSWEDAAAFCSWLSKKEGRTYRLPTEHEWNLAVVIGLDDPSIRPDDLVKELKGQFSWGTTDEKDAAKYANYRGTEDGYAGTAPVMSFKPNHLGIFDLGGNAWEWCADWDKGHVMRGGCYLNFDAYRHSTTRSVAEPDFRGQNDYSLRVPGFRVVLSTTPTPAGSATWKPVVPPTELQAQADAAGWVRPFRWQVSQQLAKDNFTDGAVRLRYRWTEGAILWLDLRRVDDVGVQLKVSADGLVQLQEWRQGQSSNRKETKIAALKPGDEGTLELATIGDRAFGRINGQQLTLKKLSARAKGQVIVANAATEKAAGVKDVSYLNLDGIADPLKALGWEVPQGNAVSAATVSSPARLAPPPRTRPS
jgi:serine/threonine protein kinase